MSQVIQKNRLHAFRKQKGRCYYCAVPMWLDRPEEFAAKHGIRKKLAKQFRCTAEHLLARQEGGTNVRNNIVAACSFCNSTRHRSSKVLSPVEYRKKVMRRIQRQKWHPIDCHHIL